MSLRTLAFALLCLLAAPSARAEVLVFAAASLKGPLDRIAADFGDVVVSYGGSGTMARQVSLGAPADVVLLANVAWMDVLVTGGHVRPETARDFASNRLVMVAAAGAADVALDGPDLLDRLGGGRLAIGLTEAVPAGIYAKEALESLDLWDVLEPHLAQVDNVRAALALVARGQAPLGIVYRTDVRVSTDVTEVAVFPSDAHTAIRYQGGLTGNAKDAERFWEYVQGPAGQAILAEAGFLPALNTDDD